MTFHRTTRAGLFAAAFATLAALGACDMAADTQGAAPASTDMTLGTRVDDTVITSSVKSALFADHLVKGFDLQVETRKGVVQLSGYVDSQAQIDRALVLAHAVAGVTGIENGMTLRGPTSTVGTAIDDTTVTGRVKTALLADPGIRSFDISVLTHQGEVQLTGFVNTQAQIELAQQIAAAAEGASSVKNELMIKR